MKETLTTLLITYNQKTDESRTIELPITFEVKETDREFIENGDIFTYDIAVFDGNELHQFIKMDEKMPLNHIAMMADFWDPETGALFIWVLNLDEAAEILNKGAQEVVIEHAEVFRGKVKMTVEVIHEH